MNNNSFVEKWSNNKLVPEHLIRITVFLLSVLKAVGCPATRRRQCSLCLLVHSALALRFPPSSITFSSPVCNRHSFVQHFWFLQGLFHTLLHFLICSLLFILLLRLPRLLVFLPLCPDAANVEPVASLSAPARNFKGPLKPLDVTPRCHGDLSPFTPSPTPPQPSQNKRVTAPRQRAGAMVA